MCLPGRPELRPHQCRLALLLLLVALLEYVDAAFDRHLFVRSRVEYFAIYFLVHCKLLACGTNWTCCYSWLHFFQSEGLVDFLFVLVFSLNIRLLKRLIKLELKQRRISFCVNISIIILGIPTQIRLIMIAIVLLLVVLRPLPQPPGHIINEVQNEYSLHFDDQLETDLQRVLHVYYRG